MRNKVFPSLLFMSILFTSCQPASPDSTQGMENMKLQISSDSFNHEGTIPDEFTCDGEDLSPQLSWNGVPSETQSLALIVDDPDAPIGTWVHWVIYDMPAILTQLPRGIPQLPEVEGIGKQGENGSKQIGYMGPCPPGGNHHRYFFKLYALDTRLDLPSGATKAELEQSMQGHILAQGQLIGLYGR